MNQHTKTDGKYRASESTSDVWQFSLGNLLELMTYAGVVFCGLASGNFAGLLFSLAIVFAIFFFRRKKFDHAVGTFFLWVTIAMLIPNVPPMTRTVERRMQCSHKLRQINLCLHNYAATHGHFPPAFTTDATGNKLHSWRVLILPYMEHQALYSQIDLTKPWNHPVNAKFANQMPDVFQCPQRKNKPGETTYVAIIGDQTMWKPDATPVASIDINDGCSNTIAVIETDQAAVNRMAPADLPIENIKIKKAGTTDILSSPHTGGTQVALADGSVRFVSDDTPHADLIGALTIDGGEPFALD